jgi:hypothetical protein
MLQRTFSGAFAAVHAPPFSPSSFRFMARLTSLCVLAFLASTLFAQEQPGTGLDFDLPSYRGTPYKALLTSDSYAELPARASLEAYCPTPGDQGRHGTCTAFAVAYHARTVLFGIQYGITDKTRLNASVFSPSFVYEQIKKPGDNDCQGGTNPIMALELMKNSGTARIATVPYQCGTAITSNALLEAVDFTITDYQPLFMPDETDRNVRVNTVRKALAEGYPVVHCFTVVKSFYKAPRVWRPQPTDGGAEGQHGKHAMLIVGYDDNLEGGCFRVLNSWGTNWADGGYVWIPYDHFATYSLGAIQVYGPRRSPDVPPPVPHNGGGGGGGGGGTIRTKEYHLKGRLHFRLRDATPMRAERVLETDDDTGEQLASYKMRESYPSGTRFRFFVTTNTETYLYAFATDNTGKVNRILPFEDGMSPLVGPNSTIAYPSEKKVIRMDDQKGTDQLLILYTDRPMSVKQLHEKLNAETGPLTDRLKNALGNRLVPWAAVNYAESDIAFELEAVAPGAVVPLLVQIPHH